MSDPRLGAVRSLSPPATVVSQQQKAVLDEVTPLRATVARLEAALVAERSRQKQVVAEARAAAHEEGVREGLAAAQKREDERLEVLRAGVGELRQAFDERLGALEGLAVVLARACLARLFDQPEDMATMVTSTLSRHVAQLRDETLMSVRVSGADFSDPVVVTEKVTGLGEEVEVSIDPKLPSGACRASYAMGRIDLDVPEQWATLAALLDESAA